MLHMNKEQHEKKKEIKVNLNDNMYIVGIEQQIKFALRISVNLMTYEK